jgi:2-polyprenyl-3-methyl-5-hydroxy-6-metoxy-1,4-benzoquinol methylase
MSEPVLSPNSASSAPSAPVTQADIEQFYDAVVGRRLHHFVYGNDRVDAALDFVQAHLPSNALSVLDVGCGIGYSSFCMTQWRAGRQVHGVDIGHENIAAAQKLFAAPGLRFTACDLLDYTGTEQYDAIVMMDVFEHFPLEHRARVYQVLSRLLAPRASILITVPSVLQQERLRKQNPAGLQVVDEEVSEADLVALSQTVQGHIHVLRHVSIYNRNDYMHVLIERGDDEMTLSTSDTALRGSRWQRSVNFRRHQRLVRERLGLQVQPDGTLVKP